MEDSLIEYRFEELKDLVIEKGKDVKELTEEMRKGFALVNDRVNGVEKNGKIHILECPVNENKVRRIIHEEVAEIPKKQIIDLGKVANAIIKVAIVLSFLGGIIFVIGEAVK